MATPSKPARMTEKKKNHIRWIKDGQFAAAANSANPKSQRQQGGLLCKCGKKAIWTRGQNRWCFSCRPEFW